MRTYHGRKVDKNNLQSIKGRSLVRNSINGVRNTKKKNPISGGSFGNPMLKKTNVQKSINMAATGTLSQNKRAQVGQKRI